MSSCLLKNASSPNSLPEGITVFGGGGWGAVSLVTWLGKGFSSYSLGSQKILMPNAALCLTYCDLGQFSAR